MACKRTAISPRSGTWLAMLIATLLLTAPMAMADDGERSRPITFPPAPAPLELPEDREPEPRRSDEFGNNKAPLPGELEQVGIERNEQGHEERLGAQVPLDLMFTDSSGRRVRLGDYFDGDKPVILNLGYYTCPMLCGQIWQGMVQSLREMSWTPGENFEVITLSFDPKEGTNLASAKKKSVLERLGRPEAAEGWHFLTGEQANIERVAQAVGYNYQYLPDQREFAHAAAIVILSPDGDVSRYLYGVKFAPQRVRLSLVEASEGKVGSTTDQILLYCFHYDPTTGQYTWAVMNLMRAGGALTVIALGLAIGFMTVRERRRRGAAQPSSSNPPDTSSEG